jgi:hypothetical protein
LIILAVGMSVYIPYQIFYKGAGEEIYKACAAHWYNPSDQSRWEELGGCMGVLLWRMEGLGCNKSFQDGASKAKAFPDSRPGKLDKNLLLKNSRMEIGDTLFFYQLLLPMCDPAQSGIHGDPHKAFYSKVEGFTNLYAYYIGLGGLYGHKFKPVDLYELVLFDGVVVRDRVPSGSNGALYQQGGRVGGKRNPEENVTDSETNENPRKKTFIRDTTKEG